MGFAGARGAEQMDHIRTTDEGEFGERQDTVEVEGGLERSSVFIVVNRAARDADRRRRPSRAVFSSLSSCSSTSRAEISLFSRRRTRPSST